MTRDLSEWPRLLKEEWDERARSPSRDFYVASHPGWNDPEVWAERARADADWILQELPATSLSVAEVLEIGCGIGRLTTALCERVRGYSGFDISPLMVEEAEARCSALGQARFAVGDGSTIPDVLKDRQYDLIIAAAVFIHCPEEIIHSLIRDSYNLLAVGGEMRLQLRADVEDPTGVIDMAAAAPLHEETCQLNDTDDIDRELIDNRHYAGKAFGYDEARVFLSSASPGTIALVRIDLSSIYASIAREKE